MGRFVLPVSDPCLVLGRPVLLCLACRAEDFFGLDRVFQIESVLGIVTS